MSKVKVMRASGHPIKLDEIGAYKNEWREAYDKMEKRCRIAKGKGLDFIRLNKLADRVEQILMKKYERISEWDLLQTSEQWVEKLEEYGNIMVSRRRDDGSIIYVIMDEDFIQGLGQ